MPSTPITEAAKHAAAAARRRTGDPTISARVSRAGLVQAYRVRFEPGVSRVEPITGWVRTSEAGGEFGW